MKNHKLLIIILFFNFLILSGKAVAAEQLLIAVASNFYEPALMIAREFEKKSGYKVTISTASTGKLYAQIINGAPFDIFLAADEEAPTRLEEQNFAVEGSRFTYATGRLAFWSRNKPLPVPFNINILKTNEYQRVAIANPKLTPYGQATKEFLNSLNLYADIENKLIFGENVNQTFQYVKTGAADAGFIAFSKIKSMDDKVGKAYWILPNEFYSPIKQQAVLLMRAQESEIASLFLNHLKSSAVRDLLANEYGYH